MDRRYRKRRKFLAIRMMTVSVEVHVLALTPPEKTRQRVFRSSLSISVNGTDACRCYLFDALTRGIPLPIRLLLLLLTHRRKRMDRTTKRNSDPYLLSTTCRITDVPRGASSRVQLRSHQERDRSVRFFPPLGGITVSLPRWIPQKNIYMMGSPWKGSPCA